MNALLPANETLRLAKLRAYKILDTASEDAFESIAFLASHICNTPVALVSLVDEHRQWSKAKVGLNACETSRDIAFCSHVILQPDVLIIPDTTQDERFADNPLVTGDPKIRFYAGAPLTTPDGYALGSLCVIDYHPRTLTPVQIEALKALSGQVVAQLELKLNLETLKKSEDCYRQQASELEQVLTELQQTQSQLIQSEKMSSLGQLVAGIAHEINNPVSFIHGNLNYVQGYTQDLLKLVQLYQNYYPDPSPEIQLESGKIDLEFIQNDLPKTLYSMKLGSDRIREIVLALRIFSRLNEAEVKPVNIHEGLDSALLILQHRLKASTERPEIQIIKDYAPLPLVNCYAGLLNQVFMNILSNAVDSLEEKAKRQTYQECCTQPGQITLRTAIVDQQWVQIAIADNGTGISPNIQQRIFDPFFTTKPIGKGTGMGMSISYQIVTERHGGKLECFSTPGVGTEFVVQIPLRSFVNG